MNRDDLRSMLVLHEGLRLRPYKCTAGKMTIGVGRNLDDNGITQAEAFALLENDIIAVEADLDRTWPWWRQMSEARRFRQHLGRDETRRLRRSRGGHAQ